MSRVVAVAEMPGHCIRLGGKTRTEPRLWTHLNRNPLHFVERNLILSPIVELRRSRRLVVGDVLRGFKLALVLQVRGDAGRPESLVPDPHFDAVPRVRRWIMR
jgi:hypothetical protein